MGSKSRLILALVPVLGLLGGCREDADLPPYPMKTEQRIELPGSSSSQDVRTVTYAPDGVTPISARIEFRDGKVATATYHSNGAVKEWTEYYQVSMDGKRQLRLRATLSDAERYISDELYRPDGTLERQGREVNREFYDASWFFEDGKTVSRHKNIKLDAEKTVLLDEKFRRTGTLLSQRRQHSDGKIVLTTFGEVGLPTAQWTTNKNYRYGAFYEQYYEDGVNVRIKARFDPYSSVTTLLRRDGTVEQVRGRDRYFNTLRVEVADAKEKVVLRQIWRFTTGDEGKLLRQVFDVHNGNVREMQLYPDGKTVQWTIENGVERLYRKDGTLEQERDRATGKSRNFTREDHILLQVPASYFVDPANEPIPTEVPRDL
jgi:antitoxin component YwqK of YwqJK toxin-antitoxin module